MKLSELKTVKKAKENGLWLSLIDEAPELEIKVKYITPAFSSQMVQLLKDVKEDNALEKEERLRQIIADELICDYRGVEDEEGKPLHFSKEVALEIINTFDLSANKILELAKSENKYISEIVGKSQR